MIHILCTKILTLLLPPRPQQHNHHRLLSTLQLLLSPALPILPRPLMLTRRVLVRLEWLYVDTFIFNFTHFSSSLSLCHPLFRCRFPCFSFLLFFKPFLLSFLFGFKSFFLSFQFGPIMIKISGISNFILINFQPFQQDKNITYSAAASSSLSFLSRTSSKRFALLSWN